MECSIEGCKNTKYATGLCNAHYLRKRKGKNMTTPIRITGGVCHCGKPNYGHGLCQSHYTKDMRKRRWLFFIDYKGGKCQRCNGVFHYSVYDFHHRDPMQKDMALGNHITDRDMKTLTREVDKCDLLCSNCHREHHFGSI